MGKLMSNEGEIPGFHFSINLDIVYLVESIRNHPELLFSKRASVICFLSDYFL